MSPASLPVLPLEYNETSFPPPDLWSDEPPMESSIHVAQMMLLILCLERRWRDRHDFFVTGNLTIYFNPQQLKSVDFRGPDFFVVLGTVRKERRSWTVWHEGGKYPNVIVEILSSSTSKIDRGLKKKIYQDTFKTPEYFLFDPETLSLEGFHLVGLSYVSISPGQHGWLWCGQLGLFFGVQGGRLRMFEPDGTLVLTSLEAEDREHARADAEAKRAKAEAKRAKAEAKRAKAEAKRADAAALRADHLAARLRALGIDPDSR
ncbi:MAG: Uma2 family endonuclease [Myxococcales bacterium]